MVKICPICKKFVPISAISCPICGNAKLVLANPPSSMQLNPSQVPTQTATKQKKKKRRKAPFIILILIVALIGGAVVLTPLLNPCRNGHDWQAATCTIPKICKTCGEKLTGSEKGHSWNEATCTKPKTCKVCGETFGSAKGHSWQPATCTRPKTCSVCLKTTGTKLAHNVQDYICTTCGESVVKSSDVPNILDITSAKYEINSVGGIDQYMTFRNKSSTKTINYIDLDISFYNAVGDIIRNEIGRGTIATLQYTGPLAPGRSSGEIYWRACFYNATFSGTMRINEIRIRYSDGTRLVLDKNVADDAVVRWRS